MAAGLAFAGHFSMCEATVESDLDREGGSGGEGSSSEEM